jgi:hypothetical protein
MESQQIIDDLDKEEHLRKSKERGKQQAILPNAKKGYQNIQKSSRNRKFEAVKRVLLQQKGQVKGRKQLSPYKKTVASLQRFGQSLAQPSYGYQQPRQARGAGRPQGSYRKFLPGVGFVPVQIYRQALAKQKAIQRARQEMAQGQFSPSEMAGGELSVEELRNIPRNPNLTPQEQKTLEQGRVQFGRKDFNLTRQEERFNLMRDMPETVDYQYMEANLISGGQTIKRKHMGGEWWL